ncbi:hypothetical protein CHGG_07139 [Chaetomium globosum CBS 148.51]|uniref:GDP/GTP exchange factor Sec2 N-terminal domain-containing protein n=1 Tax=Chaetomium globosum (strain ATCC 6205 / CBS 148.51 / DSM 1962 / NBRC 6347 / NRRL 1970) TaxID=306901 RepID=Q2GY15_CHAGB|nr:uncharacterized protein CHGG_07139 [Chaetomium globosum CBS 148.51]EAQ85886.1 hypothetical protein CHGG_07139 [Chaetomium globosum CBS 148.51]
MTVASPGTLRAAPTQTPCCPNCGFGADLPPFEETQTALLDAQKHISDLQAQVRLLNQKASAAVDRWADYEDELAKLRAQLDARPQTPTSASAATAAQHQQTQKQTSLPTPPSSAAGLPSPSPSRASFLTTSAATRISALLTRKSPPAPVAATPAPTPAPTLPPTLRPLTNIPQQKPSAPSPIPSLPSSASYPPHHHHHHHPNTPPSLPPSAQLTPSDLLSALSREQALRAEAEGRLSETSREVEELSASLFEQANEMVAAERRARARLEQRVGELERREGDKRRRLERLERAVGRIERVRGVLGELEGLEGVVGDGGGNGGGMGSNDGGR